MNEVSKDLVRLCTLLHTKNELQSMRHRARHKERKYSDALDCKKHQARIKRLERKANVASNPDLKKLEEMEKIAKSLTNARYIAFKGIADAKVQVHQVLEIAGYTLAQAKDARPYAHQNYERLANKFKCMKSTELTILKRQQHIANEQAKLEIALFTRAHRKEIAQICKRNKWRVLSDLHSAFYFAVILQGEPRALEDKDYLAKDREQIKVIASTQILEEAMVKA